MSLLFNKIIPCARTRYLKNIYNMQTKGTKWLKIPLIIGPKIIKMASKIAVSA